jgi:general secretion pathway protein A
MYLDYFHLTREPFHITPDPAFLFLSESHKQAMATILYGIRVRKGFVAITGGVGVGKTTIVRASLAKTSSQLVKAVYVFNANISFAELVETIYQELGLTVTGDNVARVVHNLHLSLIEEHTAGRTVVLIIDEAQNMPVATLENLRMLSNLETADDKLIQIVLVGQPEFDDVLGRHELRQLKQRIAMRTVIAPLTPKESMAYIESRLAKAGAADASIFARGALSRIIKEARGIPRNINVLCDNALITACGHGHKRVTVPVVKEVMADLRGQNPRYPLRWGTVSAAAALCLTVAMFLVFQYGHIGQQWADKLVGPIERALFAGKERVLQNQTLTAHQTAPERMQYGPAETNQARILPPAVDASPQAAPGQAATQTTPPGQANTVAKRIVRKGENFIQLTRETYGRTDSELLERVKSRNPQIKNVQILVPGNEIYFPDVSETPATP